MNQMKMQEDEYKEEREDLIKDCDIKLEEARKTEASLRNSNVGSRRRAPEGDRPHDRRTRRRARETSKERGELEDSDQSTSGGPSKHAKQLQPYKQGQEESDVHVSQIESQEGDKETGEGPGQEQGVLPCTALAIPQNPSTRVVQPPERTPHSVTVTV
jgi:hypothetical protein